MPKIISEKKKIVFSRSERKVTPEFQMFELVAKLPKDITVQVIYTQNIGWTVILLDKILACVQGINHNANENLLLALEDAIQNSKQK